MTAITTRTSESASLANAHLKKEIQGFFSCACMYMHRSVNCKIRYTEYFGQRETWTLIEYFVNIVNVKNQDIYLVINLQQLTAGFRGPMNLELTNTLKIQ